MSPLLKNLIIIVITIGSLIIVVLGFKLMSAEDDWLCQNGQWVKHGNPSSPMPEAGCGPEKPTFYDGEIIEQTPNLIKIEELNGTQISFFVDNNTKVIQVDGNAVDTAYLHQSYKISAGLLKGAKETFYAEEIKILTEPNIIVSQPTNQAEIGLPVIISGEARVFENTFSYRIKDAQGKILMENQAMANAPDAGQYGQFEISINYPQPGTANGTIEVFEYSAKDGSEINKVTIPIVFKQVESITVTVYFSNDKKDPEALDCANVYSVDRRISKTQAIAQAALTELLNGPYPAERQEGYLTNINQGVKIQSLTIENEIAKVDFNKTLDQAVGGSCRVAAIRAQITKTLEQFSTVKQIIISIDGRTEDILQP
jgi:hypothetical protein